MLSFWRHDTSTPVNKQGVKLYKALPRGTIGRSLADQFSEDQICSGQGFVLIIGAIRHHFRSHLEAEPEVQAEIALYQSTRSPKGTFVEYTSRISNKLREMESGFKELLPPKLKGFIIKRQAKLTHDGDDSPEKTVNIQERWAAVHPGQDRRLPSVVTHSRL